MRRALDDQVLGGFLGAGVSYTSAHGSTVLGAAAEGRLASDGSQEIGGGLRAELRFVF